MNSKLLVIGLQYRRQVIFLVLGHCGKLFSHNVDSILILWFDLDSQRATCFHIFFHFTFHIHISHFVSFTLAMYDLANHLAKKTAAKYAGTWLLVMDTERQLLMFSMLSSL